MTSTKIHLSFDADLQPIGYALATELVGTDASWIALPQGRDLFGWELGPQPHGATPTGSPTRWAVPYEVPYDQMLADDQLIEAVRAERVDEHHPDPLARLLARWRAGITTVS